MKVTFILLLSLIAANTASAKSCFIQSFDKILYISNKNMSSNYKMIQKSDCPQSIKSLFLKRVFNSTGVISQRILNSSEELKKEGFTVNLSPQKIKLIKMSEKLFNNFQLKNKWSFGNIKFNKKINAVGLDQGDSLEISCDLCHTTGEKNISLNISNPLKNFQRRYWINATVYISTPVLTPKRSISPSERELTPSDFQIRNINVTRPENYFTNRDQLVFYKVNKPIAAGSGITFSDLSPINLVSSGVPTQVILKSKSLQLQGSGIPRQNGKFGEVIKLHNPKSKKIISGRVIDFNKVLVDL